MHFNLILCSPVYCHTFFTAVYVLMCVRRRSLISTSPRLGREKISSDFLELSGLSVETELGWDQANNWEELWPEFCFTKFLFQVLELSYGSMERRGSCFVPLRKVSWFWGNAHCQIFLLPVLQPITSNKQNSHINNKKLKRAMWDIQLIRTEVNQMLLWYRCSGFFLKKIQLYFKTTQNIYKITRQALNFQINHAIMPKGI